MSVAFIVYQLCDKDRLATECLEEYIRKNQEYRFSTKLFCVLEEHGINEKNFLDHTITQLVLIELQKWYDYLESDSD